MTNTGYSAESFGFYLASSIKASLIATRLLMSRLTQKTMLVFLVINLQIGLISMLLTLNLRIFGMISILIAAAGAVWSGYQLKNVMKVEKSSQEALASSIKELGNMIGGLQGLRTDDKDRREAEVRIGIVQNQLELLKQIEHQTSS
jgi:hypothetical protein